MVNYELIRLATNVKKINLVVVLLVVVAVMVIVVIMIILICIVVAYASLRGLTGVSK